MGTREEHRLRRQAVWNVLTYVFAVLMGTVTGLALAQHFPGLVT